MVHAAGKHVVHAAGKRVVHVAGKRGVHVFKFVFMFIIKDVTMDRGITVMHSDTHRKRVLSGVRRIKRALKPHKDHDKVQIYELTSKQIQHSS